MLYFDLTDIGKYKNKFRKCNSVLKNISSFGFAKGRLAFWAKPNVLKCAAGFFSFG
jgi:hypothetical protein